MYYRTIFVKLITHLYLSTSFWVELLHMFHSKLTIKITNVKILYTNKCYGNVEIKFHNYPLLRRLQSSKL